jgi:hypothetical protein
MIFGLVVSSVLIASIDAQKDASDAWEACKGKEYRDNCEYAPYGLEHNYLFSYSHDEQLKKSIVEVLPWKGFAKDDWKNLLVIKNSLGKVMKQDFLHLPDLFDGGVTPYDFPIKVFLKEQWKGTCGANEHEGMCVAVRGSLYDACDGQDNGDKCSYASLKLEKEVLKKKIPYNFDGTCERAGKVHWCKLATKEEQQIEACLGKQVGAKCQYSATGEDLYRGLCKGAHGGMALHCDAVKPDVIDACKGKVRGDVCELKGEKYWIGWCGYTDFALQCLTKDYSDKKPGDKPGEKPEAPAEEGACASLEKQVNSMSAKIDGIATKVGSAPSPPAPATRRRGGKGGSKKK